MQAHYKYSLHTCPSERAQCHILLKYPLFKTHLLVSTWKANSWCWELNFEITGHQKYSHHIDKDWQTTITVHKNIGLKKVWPATRCSLSKACANGLELWGERSLLPSEESSPQGILEVAGRPSPSIYHFQTQLLNIKVITWQGLLSSELASCFLPKGRDAPVQTGLKQITLTDGSENSTSLPSQ